jgi:hypothetical protein
MHLSTLPGRRQPDDDHRHPDAHPGSPGLSWNILRFTGLISLGHAAFFGLGAIVTRELWLAGAPLPLAVIAAMMATALFALVIGVPMLRFRGVFFSIGTLALAVAISLTIANAFPGVTSMPVEALRAYSFTGPYFLALIAAVSAVGVSMLWWRSVVGMGMMAVQRTRRRRRHGRGRPGHKLWPSLSAPRWRAGRQRLRLLQRQLPILPSTAVWSFEIILVFWAASARSSGRSSGRPSSSSGETCWRAVSRVFRSSPSGNCSSSSCSWSPGAWWRAQRTRDWVVKQVQGRTAREQD